MGFSESDISREARQHAYAGGCGVNLAVAGQDTLARAEQLLAGIPDGLDKAVRSAIDRSASHLRTQSAKAARERYDIKAANIRDEENARISYSYQNGVQAHITFAGRRIPLYRFGGASPATPTKDTSGKVPVLVRTPAEGPEEGDPDSKWRFLYPSVPAHGHVLKSTSPALFQHAFVARMENGHTGIYERTGGMTSNKKDEIEELFGPSVPQMLGSSEVAEKLSAAALDKFEERLDHEINAILNGWR